MVGWCYNDVSVSQVERWHDGMEKANVCEVMETPYIDIHIQMPNGNGLDGLTVCGNRQV